MFAVVSITLLLAAQAAATCTPIEDAEALFTVDKLTAGTLPSMCIPGTDTTNPASLTLDPVDLSSAAAAAFGGATTIDITAQYMPEGAGSTAVDLVCKVPIAEVLPLLSGGGTPKLSDLTLTCTGEPNDTVYFNLANKIVTGPPPESVRVCIEEASTGIYSATPCTADSCCGSTGNNNGGTDSGNNNSGNNGNGSDNGNTGNDNNSNNNNNSGGANDNNDGVGENENQGEGKKPSSSASTIVLSAIATLAAIATVL